MKLHPLNGKVFVTLLPKEGSELGLILPEDTDNNLDRGKVVALAEDVDPMIKEGSTVFFVKSSFNRIELEGKEFYYLSEEDIMGLES